MHKIHSKKDTICLVGILTNAKCILQIHNSRAKVKIQKIVNYDSGL